MDEGIYRAMRHYLDWAQAYPPGKPRPPSHQAAWGNPFGPFANPQTPMTWPSISDQFINLDGLPVGIRCRSSDGCDSFSTAPGGMLLMCYGAQPRYPAVPVVCLDMAFDVRDDVVDKLREPIVAALVDRGMPFMPMSFRALEHVTQTFGDLELVDRSDMQCVFRCPGPKDFKYFISGYDANESPPLYFMATLPCAVNTFADAIEALKPRSVKLAEAKGIEVLRQGDMFAIPTDYRKEDLLRLGAVFSTTVNRGSRAPSSDWEVLGRGLANALAVGRQDRTLRRGLYGTAHTAPKLAYLPDGTMFAREAIEHDPRRVLGQARNPDHRPLELPGRYWYLIAKNTVPTTGGG